MISFPAWRFLPSYQSCSL